MIARTHDEVATHRFGAALAPKLRVGDVLLLSGDLGAGKTALVKGLAAAMGVREPVTSPTFNILLVHPGDLPLYHIDLYRLENADQLEDVDYFGTLEADGVTCVEWGDRFVEAAPAAYLAVTISILGDTDREIRVDGIGERGLALAADWSDAASGLAGVEVTP